MWQTKYALAAPKNFRVGVNFRPCSKDYFLSGRMYSVAEPQTVFDSTLSGLLNPRVENTQQLSSQAILFLIIFLQGRDTFYHRYSDKGQQEQGKVAMTFDRETLLQACNSWNETLVVVVVKGVFKCQLRSSNVQGMRQEFGSAGAGASWRALGLITAGAHSSRSLKISGCKR